MKCEISRGLSCLLMVVSTCLLGGCPRKSGTAPLLPGRWTGVANPMNEPRYGHTGTLLPNGEILIVGGLHGVVSSVNPGFCEAVSSIEVFDPIAETFTVAPGSLVHPRAYHEVVRTPGPDGLIDTNDDYVVVLGGWSDRRTDSAGGPRSEGSLEVIRPDWNEDGDTGDLVVNPDPTGSPTGAALADVGTWTLPLDVACSGVSVGIGLQHFDIEWVPEAHRIGPGNNELISLGGFATWQWDECMGGTLSLWLVFPSLPAPPNCEDGRLAIAIDPDNDGDLSDTFLGEVTRPGGPWTTPVSLLRTFHTQTRVAGPDGIDGTADDAQILYGGSGQDITAACLGGTPPGCPLADIEYFDLATGAVYVGIPGCHASCGCACAGVGVGPTHRAYHVAVAAGAASGEVVLLGGTGSSAAGSSCTRAVEVITPDFSVPGNTTIRTVGLDTLTERAWCQAASALPGRANVLVTGGVDLAAGGSTASAAYVWVAQGRVDPAAPMSERRDSHAAVTFPARFAGLPIRRDRVYVFGGTDRSTVFLLQHLCGAPNVSGTAEYFTGN